MGANVLCQDALCCETLAAVIALVRFLACVDTKVHRQDTLCSEALAAITALEWSLARVRTEVVFKGAPC